MARNFNGGTDRIAYESDIIPGSGNLDYGTIFFRIKTTQTLANTQVLARWDATSRQGWGILLNNTANKISLVGYNNTTNTVLLASTTSINDGNWHNITIFFACLQGPSGATNYVNVDGTTESAAKPSQNWNVLSTNPITLGKSYDPFWGAFVGDLADIDYWHNDGPSVDDINAFNRGYSPRLIRRSSQRLYAPLVRDHQDRRGNIIVPSTGFSGTTVSDHPRIIGSST